MTQSIIYNDPITGICSVIRPSPKWIGTMVELATKDVPDRVTYEIIEDTSLKSDRTFREAWRKGVTTIDVDLPAAKDIAHEKRRTRRSELMSPHDEIIARKVPGQNTAQAEADRALLRTADATVQSDIDNAADESALKTILVNYGGA